MLWPRLLCALTVLFAPPISPGTTGHTCAWTFQGARPSSSTSCAPPPITFSSAGPKRVTLKVCTSPSTCSSVTKTVAVLDPNPAIIKITPSPTSVYPGDKLTVFAELTGMPPLAPVWSLPGGLTATTNPVTFDVPDTRYLRIQLAVSNRAGSARASLSLPVLDPRPRASIRLAPATPYLSDVVTATAGATGRAPLSYAWKLSPDGISSSTPEFSWSSAGATPGWRRLDLVVTNTVSTFKTSRSFRLEPPPLALSFSPVCPGLCYFAAGQAVAFDLAFHPRAPSPSLIEYDWDGDARYETTSTTPLAAHVYPTSGSFRPRIRLTAPGSRPLILLSSRIIFIR